MEGSSRGREHRTGTGALILFLALAGPLAGQREEGPTDAVLAGARAVRIPADAPEMRMDGLLSEDVWATAPAVEGFLQREPLVGEPATEETRVRVAYDDEALYVGILALDSRPDAIVSRILQRDRVLGSGGFGGLSAAGDDVVAILLDTFRDRRNAVVLATNPNGAQFDALVSDDGGEVNTDWNGVWDVAAQRIPGGWSAEFVIPLRSLRFGDAPSQSWGFNVTRFVQRTQEETLWRAWDRDGGGFRRVSQAGTLSGLDGLPSTGITVEAKPFGLLGRTQVETGEGVEGAGEQDGGIDVKAQVTSGLVLDLTWNTDFAQVEVDDQQVNLTRFNLFFPEKREFFLENAGLFEFGQGGFFGPPPFLMFFSRRIGIGADGPVPILGGARLTGRAGGQTLGLLSVGTDAAGAVSREAFNVVRVKRDVGSAAYIGAMATDRRGDGPANTVAGMDFQYYPHPTLETSGFAARSFTEGPGGEGWAYQGALNWTMDRWGGFLSYLNIDPETTARSGFITRTDIRRTQWSLRRTFRPGRLGVRRIDLRPNGVYQSGTDGRFQDVEVEASTSLTFENGASISGNYAWVDVQVDDPFPVAGIVPVPAGRYRLDRFSTSASTSPARSWQLSASFADGLFYDGTLETWSGTARLTPSPSFSVTGTFSRNRAVLPAGDFTADILSVRSTIAFSTRMVTNALIQYNALTDEIIANVRFNFIWRPGSDLFLVLTEERGVEDDLWALDSRGMVAKLTWLVRF